MTRHWDLLAQQLKFLTNSNIKQETHLCPFERLTFRRIKSLHCYHMSLKSEQLTPPYFELLLCYSTKHKADIE